MGRVNELLSDDEIESLSNGELYNALSSIGDLLYVVITLLDTNIEINYAASKILQGVKDFLTKEE